MSFIKRNILTFDLWLVLLLFTGTFLVYSGALDNGFLANWDDDRYITDNPDIRALTVEHLKNIFTNFYVGNYAPLQMLSYMADFQLWGLKFFGYILHNIFLHSLNGILLYLLLRTLNVSSLAAFAGAALFLIHPVQVESVAWISQRKNLLSMFFFLLSLLAYDHYASDKRSKKGAYCIANVAFVLALLAKSVAVVLPVVLIAYDLFLRRFARSRLQCVAEKIPFIVVALVFAWLTIVSQDPTTGGGIVNAYHGGSAYATFLTMLTVYQKYLINIFWPINLSAAYSPDVLVSADIRVVLPAILLLLTIMLPLFLRKHDRAPGWFWVVVFIVGFLPVMQIVPLITLMNDRYVYFPMIGLSGSLALTLDKLPNPAAKGAAVLVGLFLLTMGYCSMQRVSVWENPIALWQDATTKEGGSALSWYGLGLAYDNAGNDHAAIDAYSQALVIEPSHPDAGYNLAIVYIVQGRFGDAQSVLQKLLQSSPGRYDGILLMAHTYYFQDNFSMARLFYQGVQRMKPGAPDAWDYLSLVEFRAGQVDLSSFYWQKALASGGQPGELFLERARLESLKRQPKASLEFLQQALSMGVNDIDMIYSDPDLEFVRRQSGFNKLVDKE